MVPVGIASLSVDSRTNQPVVVLRPLTEAKGQGRILPIWIGHPEATAILLALEGAEPPRPLTHDLFRNVLETLDVVLERVEITRIEDGTFYAALILRGEERTLAIDARPSDSIALAVRTSAPDLRRRVGAWRRQRSLRRRRRGRARSTRRPRSRRCGASSRASTPSDVRRA